MTPGNNNIRRVLVPGLPVPKGAYVHAVVHGDIAYCSGQLGTDPESGELVTGVAPQTRRALQNLATVLEGLGSDLTNALQCRVYLRDPSSFAEMDAAYAEVFGDHRPARTTLPGIGFRAGVEVEIDLTAAMRQPDTE
ncbi:MAG TPA: RidA family protein [Acidimicrobiales bacterium]|nr:RidA family protein [Acidimicrobiales bacterium]